MALRNPTVVTTQSSGSHAKVAAHLSIPVDLAAKISRQVPSWSPERLTDCSFTRNRGSTFPDCKAELEVFGPSGSIVIHGREFNDHRSFFWDA
jgi:hypothetical protein